MQRHVIKEQIIDLQIDEKIPSFELQNRVSQLYRSRIIPLIEAYCDQIGNSHVLQRIDTITLDLGEICLETIETDLIQKVAEMLQKTVDEQDSTRPSSQPLARQFEDSALSVSDSSHNSTYASITEESRDRSTKPSSTHPQPTDPSTPAAQLEQFSYFLKTGLLPWWSQSLSKSSLEACAQRLIKTAPTQMKSLLHAQLKDTRQLDRLIYQFSDTCLLDLLTLAKPAWHPWVRSYVRTAQTILPHIEAPSGATPRLYFWQGLWCQISLDSTAQPANTTIRNHVYHLAEICRSEAAELVRNMLAAIHQRDCVISSEDAQQLTRQLSSLLPKPIATSNQGAAAVQDWLDAIAPALLADLSKLQSAGQWSVSLQPKLDKLKHQLALAQSSNRVPIRSPEQLRQTIEFIQSILSQVDTVIYDLDQVILSDSDRAVVGAIAQLAKSSPPLSSSNVPTTRRHSSSPNTNISNPDSSSHNPLYQKDATDPFSESDSIYIHNAGLVLFWPFLTRFFETLSLTDKENQFISTAAHQRAALLLQYLVEENTDIPEHSLPLNKLMCGLDLHQPIESNLSLSFSEKSECDNILMAVIHNWEALKGTTVSGLRQAFLQRAGILTFDNGHWLLRVERETYDILLDQLPWSIRVVKLSWMPDLLHTEW